MARKVIDNFVPQGGKHCITTSLKQIFNYYGYPLSEEMLFGLGEGLDFTYINLAAAPMVSGRAKVMEFEENLSVRLGVSIRIKQGKAYERIFDKTNRLIDGDNPVLAYVDMPYMDYFGMDENSHFGGHSIVLFGYDDENSCYYVSDRDHSEYPIRTPLGPISQDYHLVSYEQMEKARSSRHRPFPANNKYLEFDFSEFRGITSAGLTGAITATCDKMLNPPAHLKGVNGIAKFAREVKKWRRYDSEKLKRAGATNYFQIHADGGTGGGIFRRMFGGFLMEAAPVLNNKTLTGIGQGFMDLSGKWNGIGSDMWMMHETGDAALLEDISNRIHEVYQLEVELLLKLQDQV